MAVAVPGQGSHAVAESEVQTVEGVGDFAGTGCDLTVIGAVDIAFYAAGDYFAFAMVALSEIHQGGDQQLLALHQT